MWLKPKNPAHVRIACTHRFVLKTVFCIECMYLVANVCLQSTYSLRKWTEKPCLASDPERQTAWQHRCWPLSDVHQKESTSHRSGHRGAYLSPQGSTEHNTLHKCCYFSREVSRWINSRSCTFLFKVKSQDIFDAWVSKLRHHRLYRQNEIVRSPRDATMRTFPPPATIESPLPAANVVHDAKVCSSSSVLLIDSYQLTEIIIVVYNYIKMHTFKTWERTCKRFCLFSVCSVPLLIQQDYVMENDTVSTVGVFIGN